MCCQSSCGVPSRVGWVAAAVVQGRSERQAGPILLQAILMWMLHRSAPRVHHAGAGSALGHRCSRGSPLTPLCFSSVFQASQLAPCIAVPAAAETPPGLSPSPRTVGMLRGCGGRCGSRSGRGPFSRSARLPSRCAGAARQYLGGRV